MAIEADDIWDLWIAASAEDPELAPLKFAARFGEEAKDVLALLEVALDLQDQAPPPSLVNLLTGEISPADGRPRFAGFRLEEELGHGTSGIVFRATDLREGRDDQIVALKILNPLLAAAPERRELILREAEIAGELDHPGIVRVLDSGVERGYAWIAAEFVEGRSLDEVIEDDLDPAKRQMRAIELALQMADALEHAHGHGVVHRDLKPANILLDEEGKIRILDFGLARSEGTAFSLSSTGDAVGTPLYMAPEQARGQREPGPPVDVFAVGLILSELATGHRRATDFNLLMTLRRRAEGNTKLPQRTLAELRPGLRSVVRRCTEGHPDDRYASCEELELDLRDVAADRPPRIGKMPGIVRSLRRARRHPWRTAGVVASAALILAVAWYAWHLWYTGPVPVRIGSLQDGKTIRIDGKVRGTTHKTVPVKPGEHELELQFALSRDNDLTRFVVPLSVPRGADRIDTFYFFEPPLTVAKPTHLSFGGLSPTGEETRFPDCVEREGPHAWIQVSAKFESRELGTIRLTIDGEEFEGVEAICAFHMPLGRHTIRIEAEGYRPVERIVDLDTPELCMLSFEMEKEKEEYEWETVLIYSVAEYSVRESRPVLDGMKIICEWGQLGHSPGQFVHKPYWAPLEDFEPGSALLEVELPQAPNSLDLWFAVQDAAPGGWSLIEAGKSPEEMFPIWVLGPEDPPLELVEGFQGFADRPRTRLPETWNGSEEEVEARLVDELAGSRTLYLRFRVGGVPVGDNVSTACALRCGALPTTNADGLVEWWPAARIRVK